MNTKEAKDFLADQAAQQAALDHTPLSDVERRMMYFTESDPASCGDPLSLNDEFEEKYDNAEYEAKMSRLLHHAYKRLRAENPGGKLQWDEAISTLEKGDHYVLVLLDVKPESVQQGPRIWAAIAWGLGLGIALVILMMLGVILDLYGLFPRSLFAWIAAAFAWVSDDPFTRRLQLEFVTIVFVGVWFVFRSAKFGVLRGFLRDTWNGATSSIRPKNRPTNRS